MYGEVSKIFRNTDTRKDKGGYFFVRGDDGHDRFAHARDVGQEVFAALQEHDRVTFDPITVPALPGQPARGNGLRAENVKRVGA